MALQIVWGRSVSLYFYCTLELLIYPPGKGCFRVCAQTVLVQSGAGSSGRAFSTQLKLTTYKIWLLGP
jgi:hypothetical protein